MCIIHIPCNGSRLTCTLTYATLHTFTHHTFTHHTSHRNTTHITPSHITHHTSHRNSRGMNFCGHPSFIPYSPLNHLSSLVTITALLLPSFPDHLQGWITSVPMLLVSVLGQRCLGYVQWTGWTFKVGLST